MAQNTKSNKSKQSKQTQQQTKKNVQDKSMQQQKKRSSGKNNSSSCCKWIVGSLFLTSLIFSVIIYDVQTNGKGVFEKSAIGKVLKNAGFLPLTEKVWFSTVSAIARGFKWIEKNVPNYLKPIMELMSDLYKISRNAMCNIAENSKEFAIAKWPIVTKFMDQYIPGVSEKIEGFYATIQAGFNNYLAISLDFFKTQVFIGKLSPENLGKALNDTQVAVAQYYSWFHKKIDGYAKLK